MRVNWGERERAPILLMLTEIMYVRAYAHRYVPVRPPDCACANVVETLLSLLVLQLLVPGLGYTPNTARKRPLDMADKTGMTQATGPRQACYRNA